MKTVAVYSYPDDAQIAVSVLEANGVAAFVPDEFTINWYWLYTNAIGGIRVQVDDECFAEARALLSESVDPELTPRCPHCEAINLRQLRIRWGDVVAMACGFLLPGAEPKYQCQKCRKIFPAREASHDSYGAARLEREAISVRYPAEHPGPLPLIFRVVFGMFLGALVTTVVLPFLLLSAEFEVTIADSYVHGAIVGGTLVPLLGMVDDWRKKHYRRDSLKEIATTPPKGSEN